MVSSSNGIDLDITIVAVNIHNQGLATSCAHEILKWTAATSRGAECFVVRLSGQSHVSRAAGLGVRFQSDLPIKNPICFMFFLIKELNFPLKAALDTKSILVRNSFGGFKGREQILDGVLL